MKSFAQFVTEKEVVVEALEGKSIEELEELLKAAEEAEDAEKVAEIKVAIEKAKKGDKSEEEDDKSEDKEEKVEEKVQTKEATADEQWDTIKAGNLEIICPEDGEFDTEFKVKGKVVASVSYDDMVEVAKALFKIYK